jgi:hypothetical protein
LRFDFETYRTLDPACRRLYLLLKIIFWRADASPEFDLHDLAVNVIGFAATQETWKLKQKLVRCIDVLLNQRIIRLPEGILHSNRLFTKRTKGKYGICFHRGPHFLEASSADTPSRLTDSPLFDPLHTIGFDDPSIRRIVKMYQPRLIAECADMTLAASERFGASFFKKSPQAYFTDNIREQAAGKRTAPDWWRELRKQEERQRWESEHEGRAPSRKFEEALDAYLKTEAREAFERTMDRILQDLKAGGQSESDAKVNASHFARTHFVRRFRAEHPEWNEDSAT